MVEQGGPTERWPSGRRRLTRNQLCPCGTGGSNPSLSVTLTLGLPGEVRERSNRRAWRARGRQKCPVGSNPTLSAVKGIVLGGEVAVPCTRNPL